MTKQTKITKSARGEECQIRLPGICNFNPETTVFCHFGGAGMGRKHYDIHGAYGCSSCHDAVDGRFKLGKALPCHEVKLWFYDAMVRTQIMLMEKGLICLK